MKNKYIVTGGAGFIGSALVHELNQSGIDSIIIVDHLGDSEKWKNLRGLRFLDYIEKQDFRKLIEEDTLKGTGFKAIIHLGACSDTMEQDASYLIDNNFRYSKEIANFALSNSIRFIYASSAATYGDGSNGWDDDETQMEKLRPLNIYGYSKQIFDLWLKTNALLNQVTGLKFTNVFGPNEWHKKEMRSVVCKAYGQIRDSGKLSLFKSYREEYKDGEQMRDFLYVKDAVKMIGFFLANPSPGIYNIGSGKAETWNSLAEAIFTAMGVKPLVEYIDMPDYLRKKYQYFSCAKMEKIKCAGYKMEPMPLRDAVADYVKNYLLPEKHLAD